MMYHWTASGFFAALAICISGYAVSAQPNPNLPRPAEITAAGRAEIAVTPERATVLASIETRAASAAAAAAANSAKMTSLLEALKRAGLSQSDIATLGYSVGQDPRGMRIAPTLPQPPIEFLARNTVKATVRRIDDVGKIIDAALAGGATSIASVQMTSPNTDEARRTALAQAVAQAQRDAEVLARAAGGSLGRLLGMSSGPSGPGGQYSSDAYAIEANIVAGGSAAGYSTMVSPRDILVAVVAFGRWEFIPGAAR
jgi:uncharacterized protein YggE